MKLFLSTLLFFISTLGYSQKPEDYFVNKNWILHTSKIEKANKIVLKGYSKDQIELNTMLWVFKEDGTFETDYQTSEDIEACIGVDFLDLDVDVCTWKYNVNNNTIVLYLKGGYASIDDFLLQAEYNIESIIDEFTSQEIFILSLKNKISFKDLTKSNRNR